MSLNNISSQPQSLSKWGLDVAENTNTQGGLPGDASPEECAGCRSTLMRPSVRADGRKYWVCADCSYLHESEDSQGRAHGLSAYANKFKVGDFVRRPGSWIVSRVDSVHRSDKRGGGFFSSTDVTMGSKYNSVGKKSFEHAHYYELVEDPKGYIEGHGYKFVPDAGK